MGSNNNNSITTTLVVFDYRTNGLFIFFTIPLYSGDNNICVRVFFFFCHTSGRSTIFFFFLPFPTGGSHRTHAHTRQQACGVCTSFIRFLVFNSTRPILVRLIMCCVCLSYRNESTRFGLVEILFDDPARRLWQTTRGQLNKKKIPCVFLRGVKPDRFLTVKKRSPHFLKQRVNTKNMR